LTVNISDLDVTTALAGGKLAKFDGRIGFAPAIGTDFTPGPDSAVEGNEITFPSQKTTPLDCREEKEPCSPR
jgi:hypothetical protein